MTWFKIESVHYGWFGMSAGQIYFKASNYTDYDMPRRLLEKIVRLISGESEREYLYLLAEPHAALLVLSVTHSRICMEAYDLIRDSNDLPRQERDALGLLGECWANLAVLIPDAADDLVTEFSLYENGNGRALYETHWMPFPQDAYDALKALAFRFAGERMEDEDMDELMCTTYLQSEENAFVSRTPDAERTALI